MSFHHPIRPDSEGWRPLGTPPAELALDYTLPTGQSFRWRRAAPGEYVGVVGRRAVRLLQTPTDVLYRVIARGADAPADGDAAALAVLMREAGVLPERLPELIDRLPVGSNVADQTSTQEQAWILRAAQSEAGSQPTISLAVDGTVRALPDPALILAAVARPQDRVELRTAGTTSSCRAGDQVPNTVLMRRIRVQSRMAQRIMRSVGRSSPSPPAAWRVPRLLSLTRQPVRAPRRRASSIGSPPCWAVARAPALPR
jgi:hypothetical protein